jgi:hypothetical protein
MRHLRYLAASAVLLAIAPSLDAQQTQPPTDLPPAPAVGDMAPDIQFRPITRDGVASSSSKLSDYRDQTVVLWFFVRARTRG